MSEIMADHDAEYARELVKAICTEVGPGLAGTPQERARAALIEKELVAHLGAGKVVVEEFAVAPGACLGTLPLGALCTLIAALLNLAVGRLAGISPGVIAAAALALSLIPLLLLIFEFLLGHEVVDPLFPKKRSVNVIGTLHRPGTGPVKRLLILSGHHDSALEFTWSRLLGYGFFFAVATIAIGSLAMPVMAAIQLAGAIAGHAGALRAGTLGWGLLAYPIAPAIFFSLFFNRGRRDGGVVPGAVDNLSACALTAAVCRFLVRNPACIPEDTEIRFVSFGSEEAGLRGSRRYVARHLDELQRLDARLLNIEMVAHPEIGILTSDANGTVKNSPEMVSAVAAAAERAGVPYKVQAATVGNVTDAAPFSRAGLKATALLPFQFPQQMVAFYHQRSDRPELLTIEPLLNVLKLALEWVRAGGE